MAAAAATVAAAPAVDKAESPEQLRTLAPSRVIHVLLAQTKQRLVTTLERYGEDLTAVRQAVPDKEPRLVLNDDKAGKPEGIHLMIGRRPRAAFGNSAGDREMLEYTKAGDGARLTMLVPHDDATREYAIPSRVARRSGTPVTPSNRRA